MSQRISGHVLLLSLLMAISSSGCAGCRCGGLPYCPTGTTCINDVCVTTCQDVGLGPPNPRDLGPPSPRAGSAQVVFGASASYLTTLLTHLMAPPPPGPDTAYLVLPKYAKLTQEQRSGVLTNLAMVVFAVAVPSSSGGPPTELPGRTYGVRFVIKPYLITPDTVPDANTRHTRLGCANDGTPCDSGVQLDLGFDAVLGGPAGLDHVVDCNNADLVDKPVLKTIYQTVGTMPLPVGVAIDRVLSLVQSIHNKAGDNTPVKLKGIDIASDGDLLVGLRLDAGTAKPFGADSGGVLGGNVDFFFSLDNSLIPFDQLDAKIHDEAQAGASAEIAKHNFSWSATIDKTMSSEIIGEVAPLVGLLIRYHLTGSVNPGICPNFGLTADIAIGPRFCNYGQVGMCTHADSSPNINTGEAICLGGVAVGPGIVEILVGIFGEQAVLIWHGIASVAIGAVGLYCEKFGCGSDGKPSSPCNLIADQNNKPIDPIKLAFPGVDTLYASGAFASAKHGDRTNGAAFVLGRSMLMDVAAGRPAGPAICDACMPDCRAGCGADDHCGHTCACPLRSICSAGKCVCTPKCAAGACGMDDGCQGTCQCPSNLRCINQRCQACTSSCPSDGSCGQSDGCGGTCGCPSGSLCASGRCSCKPYCPDNACNVGDACGGTCACAVGIACLNNKCQTAPPPCVPDNAAACAGKQCGEAVNNCGQTISCGTCNDPNTCQDGVCKCTPDCDGKRCGPNGCGGNCGVCPASTHCCPDGNACVPRRGECP